MDFTPEQKQALINRKSNILLSAGAGSGKTAVLTEKVYRLIKEGIDPSRLLVLTFSNAAAFEMKERIIKKIAEDPELSYLVGSLNSAHIETFDSYNLFLVKKYGYVINMPSSVEILDSDNEEILLHEIFKEQVDKFYNEISMQEAIRMYCFKDGKILEDIVLNIVKFLQTIPNPEEYIDLQKQNHRSYEYYNKIHHDFIKINREMIADIFYHLFRKISNLDLVNAEEEQINALLSIEDDEEFYNEAVNYKIVSTRKAIYRLEKDSEDSIFRTKYSKQIKNIETSLSLGIFNEEAFESIQNNLEIFDFLMNFSLIILKELSKKENSLNKMTFAEVARAALELIKRPEINDVIKNSLDFILVDEFQDTSDLQEEFLNQLKNDNLFMVGDIKQSIYGFRNANCDIFNRIQKEYSKHNGGINLQLTNNFRTREETVESINYLFSNVMTDDCGGAQYKYEHIAVSGNGYLNSHKAINQKYGFKVLEPSSEYVLDPQYATKALAEIDLIALDIIRRVNNKEQIFDAKKEKCDELRDIKFSDFCILSRAKSHFDDIKRVFTNYKIPLQIMTESDASETPSYLLFLSLFNLYYLTISNSDNQVEIKKNFMSVVRSFALRYDDSKIHEMIVNNTYLNDDIFQKLRKIASEEKEINTTVISKLLIEFNIIDNIYILEDVQDNLDKLESLVSQINDFISSGSEIEDIISYYKNLNEFDIKAEYEIKENVDDCVKLMTIHKSKGLEFKIVYIPFAGTRFNTRSKSNNVICNNLVGIELPIYDLENNQKFSFLNEYLSVLTKLTTVREEMRLFYVAITRAIDEVVFTSYDEFSGGKPLFSNCYLDFYSGDRAQIQKVSCDNLTLNRAENDNENNEIFNLSVNDFSYNFKQRTPLERASKKVVNDEEIRSKLEYGTKIHRMFELVDLKTKDTSFIKDLDVKRIIDKALTNKIFNFSEHDKIFKEYEFINNDVKGIIDLVVFSQNDAFILDYKLKNIEDEAYEKQLNYYRTYVEQITQKHCRTYLFSIIDNVLKEIIYEKWH